MSIEMLLAIFGSSLIISYWPYVFIKWIWADDCIFVIVAVVVMAACFVLTSSSRGFWYGVFFSLMVFVGSFVAVLIASEVDKI